MKKTLKRGISLTMTALLCLSAPAAGAFAAAAEEETGEVLLTVEETVSAEEDGYDLSNDELFAVYVENVLYPDSGIAAYAAEMGERLTGTTTGNVYDIVKPVIVKIAEGTISSTEIEISGSSLGLTQTSWTAADLGGISLDSGDTLSDEAKVAVQNKIGLNLNALQSALLADCPYEMYWYDKTPQTGGLKAAFAYKCYRSTTTNKITSISIDSIALQFSVAADYAASGQTGTYTTNATKIQSVSTAKENAAKIVEAHKNESDYKKLDSYRQAICDLVKYNSDAASTGYTGGYGDPWQLIYVFDGDSATDVVCEGYAKAFQYLCDLTDSFLDADIWCYCVTGKMSTSGNVGHMWNLVTMDDGKNYLVDVTNCDGNNVGAPDKLFMAWATSGSVKDGYTFKTGSSSIIYTYDESIIEDFGKDYLTVADANYVPDAMAIAQYTVGGRTLTDNQQGLADHNGDREVTPLDALLAAYGQ